MKATAILECQKASTNYRHRRASDLRGMKGGSIERKTAGAAYLSCIIDVDRSMHLKIGFHQLQTAGMTPLDRDTGLGQRKHHRIWGMAEQYFRQRQLLGNLMDVEIDPVIRCTHDRENGGDVDGGKSDLRV